MISIRFYGGVNEIGGTKILLEDETGKRVLLDFGRRMGYAGKYFSGMLNPRGKTGIRDYMKLNIIPRIDGVYRDCLVNMNIRDRGVDALEELADNKHFKGKTIDDMDIDHAAFKDAKDYWSADDVVSYEAWEEKHGKPFVEGIFLSHAHYDHIQDIHFLSEKIPVYCTKETKVMAEVVSKISTFGEKAQYYFYSSPTYTFKKPHGNTYFEYSPTITWEGEGGEKQTQRNFITMKDLDTVKVGNMEITMIETDHSLIGSCAYLIKNNEHSLLYTGDIRFHGHPKFTIDSFCKKLDSPIEVLLIEGTRIKDEESLTEDAVKKNLIKEMKGVEGLILADFTWKDVQRFNTIRAAASAVGRTLLIEPRLAFLLHELHEQLPGYPDPMKMKDVKVYMRRQNDFIYAENDYMRYKFKAGYLLNWVTSDGTRLNKVKKRIGTPEEEKGDKEILEVAFHHLENGVKAFEVRENPEKYVLMFTYWKANELFDLSGPDCDMSGSKYIRASCEPFNDEMMIDERKMMNWLDHFHVDYDTDEDEEEVEDAAGKKIMKKKTILKRNHVSGHASRSELKELVEELQPDFLYPIHTEHPEMYKDMAPKKTKLILDIELGKEYKHFT
ncbi:MAG: MBL fold metallo-hydrolase RNA specificity domain-containing protein [Candidatus Hodarchaeota archaeon]